MEEKKSRYTVAQKKSFKKYINNKARIELVTTPEYKNYIIDIAKASGMSVNAFMLKAVEDKAENRAEELPSYYINNLMDWLKAHGHTDEEITDCIKKISTEKSNQAI